MIISSIFKKNLIFIYPKYKKIIVTNIMRANNLKNNKIYNKILLQIIVIIKVITFKVF